MFANSRSCSSRRIILHVIVVLVVAKVLFLVSFAQEDSEQIQVQEGDETIVVESEEQDAIAAIRVANMLPGVSLVDLIVDGKLKIPDVGYGQVSSYALIPIKGVSLALMPHVAISPEGVVLDGTQAPQAINFEVELESNNYYTIILSHIGEKIETTEAKVFVNSLISIFATTFEPPPPGQARIRIFNTSRAAELLDIYKIENEEELTLLVKGLETPAVGTQAVEVGSGSYRLSFGQGETELDVNIRAGTFYKFYIFRDGEQLVVNVDIDGIIATLMGEE